MKSHKSEERGQALLMITFACLLMFGVLGLVTDIGWMHYKQQAAQAAAEAAAIAGAEGAKALCTYSCGTVGCETNITSCSDVSIIANLANACHYAQSNGFSAGGNGGRQDVTIQANVTGAPPTASAVSSEYWVTVRAVETIPQLFSYVLGRKNGLISARATAVVQGSGGAGCIYVLDPADSQTFFVSGASLTANCGIMVSSSSSTAMNVNGNSTVTATGYAIDIHGGMQTITDQSVVTPTPTQNYAAIADPLASLAAPSFSKAGCDFTNFNQSNSQANSTLTPGVYCGGINIGGGTATFASGTYILNGGGLTLQGANTTVKWDNGSGVFFYDSAYSTTSGFTGTFGPLLISGQPTVTLQAPGSGTYQGILFYQDRSVAVGSTGSQVNGNSLTTLTGTIYLPTTTLLYTGQSTTGSYTGLVTYKLTINGATHLNHDADGSKTGLGKATVSLVE
jgi:hypothetical protein